MLKKIRLFTEEEMKAIGKRIQITRKSECLKAIDFADFIGIGKDQLSRIENGKVPCKLEYLFVIAQYLNVTTDYLLYGRSYIEGAEHFNCIWFNLSENERIKAIKIIEIMKE